MNQPTFDSSRGMPTHIDNNKGSNWDQTRRSGSGLVTFQNSNGANSQRVGKETGQHSTVTLGPNQSGSAFKTGTFLDPNS